jgi:CysZ protein
VGFFRGFLAPFRGGLYIARHRLWPYLLLPILVDLALAAATMFAVQHFLRQESYVAEPLANNPVVGWLILIGLTLLGSAIIFLIAQPLLLAVFSDRLSERVERSVRGSAPTAPFLASTGRALAHGLLKLVLYAIALTVAAVAAIFSAGIGSLVGVALGAIFLAYDGFDYPLSRRGASFGKKWAYLLRHPAQTLGFGLGATSFYLIPLAIFVAPPFVAAGATLVFLDTDGGAPAALADLGGGEQKGKKDLVDDGAKGGVRKSAEM